MNIVFHTNIDAYNIDCFPINLQQVPRKGDYVHVTPQAHPYFIAKKLPTRLEVVSVSWWENHVVCELWYNDTDKKLSDLAGAETL